MRIRARLALVVTVVSATALVSVSPASAAAGPGAPGIGDPYYPTLGNGGYDVSHYNIRLSYEPASDMLSGTTTILARASRDLTGFNLDFLLTVKSVRVNGASMPFSQAPADGEVSVRFPNAVVRKGSTIVVDVSYAGVPSTVTSSQAWIQGWRRTSDGAVSVGEPYQAEWWYPSNNHPADKATHTVSVAVPDGVEVVSNGTLVGTTTGADGKVLWHWRSEKPQVTYATLLAIGQFQIESTTTRHGLPMINAFSELIPPDKLAGIREEIAQIPDLIDFYSRLLGPYPFEATGAVAGAIGSDNRGYGMETQTRPMMSWNSFGRTEFGTVVPHELAHQWFGDSVSLSRWRDLWLNEGLTMYAEYLWDEHIGYRTVQDAIDFWYDRYPAGDPFWQAPPGDPGPGRGKQFALAVYYRGAMAAHALRKAVGDKDFFRILRSWAGTNQHGNATAEQFFDLAERVSGKDLDDLFTTWLYTPGKPTT